jgi:hypothetical protein
MAKAKINFEVDEVVLSRAKAYVALHGGSLNKLVNAFFSNLGKQLDVPLDPAKKILMDLSAGRISLLQATADLHLPDAGYTLHLMREEGLPMPHLPEDFVLQQIAESNGALRTALRSATLTPEPKARRGKSARP